MLKLIRLLARQRWIPFRMKFVRRFFGPKRLPDWSFEVPFYGFKYSGVVSNEIDWYVYFLGCYAPAELSLMEAIITHLRAAGRSDIVCVDIGANVGNHALALSRIADRVFCFEPYHPIADRLADKLRSNAIENVVLHRVALGEDDRTASYHRPAKSNLGTGSLVRDHGEGSLDIPVRHGDRFFEANINFRIDLIKVDVEGYEPAILSGLAETLRENRPFVLFEFLEETKHRVSDEASLRRYLYPEVELYEISATKAGGYVLCPFDFNSSREVLAAPYKISF